MKTLSVNNLLGIKDLTKEDLNLIFETADHFKEVINRPIKKVPSLRDITIANLFFENSTRTKLSFELAEKRLSADVLNFSSSQSSVKKGETLIDTVNNILSMKVDIVVMRHPNVGAGVFLAQHVDAKIINQYSSKLGELKAWHSVAPRSLAACWALCFIQQPANLCASLP